MKLFTSEDSIYKISMEDFPTYYNSLNSVSTESLLDFFNSLRDKFSYFINSLVNFNEDYITIDVNKYRHEAISRAKKLPLEAIADKVITKPRNFKGKYIEFAPKLYSATRDTLEDTRSLINLLLPYLRELINNSNNKDYIITTLPISTLHESKKLLEKEKETITSFFPYNNQVVIAKFKEVFIAPRDIEAIYKTIDEIDSTISTELLKKEIQTKIKELYELTTILSDLEKDFHLFDKTTNAKKILVDYLFHLAYLTEFVAYLYTNINLFYKAIQEASVAIIEVQKAL